MASGTHTQRLANLEQIERDIASAMDNAASAMNELARDKPTNKQVELHAQNFLKTVNGIETNLMKQINYLSQVSTTHPHTGSSYGVHKDWQMSVKRLDHAANKVEDLDKLRMETQSANPSELRRALSHQSSFPPMT